MSVELILTLALIMAGTFMNQMSMRKRGAWRLASAIIYVALIGAYCHFSADGLFAAYGRIIIITLATLGFGTIEFEKDTSYENVKAVGFAAIWLFLLVGTYCKGSPF